jgi:hypothetical protein
MGRKLFLLGWIVGLVLFAAMLFEQKATSMIATRISLEAPVN